MSLTDAQRELRHAYRSTSVGQIYGGLVWLSSAFAWIAVGTTAGMVTLVVGGFFIYPVTTSVSRLLGNSGRVSADNPLREASITIPIVGPLAIPVALAVALFDVDWFYPAFMVVMGAHYLPFSLLYGMRVYLAVGVWMWLLGLGVALWVPRLSAAAAVVTGLTLLGTGIRAELEYRSEFEPSPPARPGREPSPQSSTREP